MLKSIMRLLCAIILTWPATTLAATESTPNAGDTAWMLVATALVLFMTLPGLALFYAGMVRAKNVLSVLMQCLTIACLATLIWFVYGYSLVFTTGGFNALIGGFDKLFLAGVNATSLSGTIPESVFIVFQMTFAIITPALIVGSFAERMKFSALLWFSGLWLTLVYLPIAHWVWGGGWLGRMGVIDFAGGTVVHINAGMAGLVAALMLGKRRGYPNVPIKPHNLGYTMAGASILWVGWFGFNAGSALAADGSAGMAMLVTQIAAATAVLTWITLEWTRSGRPSALGAASGAIAGLVAITPACGSVGPMGALVIGLTGSLLAYYAVTVVKIRAGYDDSLDAFGVHGVAGIVGALLTGIFCAPDLGGTGFATGVGNITTQVALQALGIIVTVGYCGVMSLILLKVIDAAIGLRVDAEDEQTGLDIALHEERGYNM